MFKYNNVRCTRVIDGDTIECAILLTPDSLSIKKRIRLARIDTAELHQEGGKHAKEVMICLVQNKKIELEVSSCDSFGRWIGEVIKEGKNISDLMLEKGLADIYR